VKGMNERQKGKEKKALFGRNKTRRQKIKGNE